MWPLAQQVGQTAVPLGEERQGLRVLRRRRADLLREFLEVAEAVLEDAIDDGLQLVPVENLLRVEVEVTRPGDLEHPLEPLPGPGPGPS